MCMAAFSPERTDCPGPFQDSAELTDLPLASMTLIPMPMIASFKNKQTKERFYIAFKNHKIK